MWWDAILTTLQAPRFLAPLLLAAGAGGLRGAQKVFSYVKGKKRRKKRIRSSSTISVRLDEQYQDRDWQVFLEVYRPAPDEAFEDWEDARPRQPLILEEGQWMFDKDRILKLLEKPSYPWKLVCTVPAGERLDCYAALVDRDYVVTGRGRANPSDDNLWDIWFLLEEAWHDEIQDVYRINQSL